MEAVGGRIEAAVKRDALPMPEPWSIIRNLSAFDYYV
jgi:hypothetical protein